MLLSIIYSLGIIQAWLIAYFLVKSRYSIWHGNSYLALFLFSIGCILSLFLARLHLGNQLPAIVFWPIVSLPTLFGPLIYWYISSFSATEPRELKTTIPHLIPYIGLLVLFSPEIITPFSEGVAHLDDRLVIAKIIIAAVIKSISIIAYMLVSLRCIGADNIKRSIPPEALNILRLFLQTFLVISIIGSILSALFWTGLYVSLWADFLELSFLTILSYMLSVYVLVTHVSPMNPRARYSQKNLTDSARQDIADELTRLMQQEKLFADERYSAKFLCQRLGITEQNLSETLALSLDTNFYDFSNRYRLKYFKVLVMEKPDVSLLELAFEAGFSSKSSFNRIVKSLTGLTPRQLKLQLQQQ